MFFRRMFQRKDSDDNSSNTNIHDNGNIPADIDDNDDELFYGESSNTRKQNGSGVKTREMLHQQSYLSQDERANVQLGGAVSSTPRAQRKFSNDTTKYCASATQLQRGSGSASTGSSAGSSNTSNTASLQLTPLWEHVLRTRTLPDNICPTKMYAEFLERLRDPEWQVRQHALRVLVDVLVVMRAKADAHMDPLVGQLIENLGHPAPTVRKGALDCLRVYLAETAMPETIMLQILDIGLNQKVTNEPFGGRLTCGVMLSLPALVQTTLHTTKRHFILRSTIDMLVQKMVEVTHQEITLKVLAKLRELIGAAEFMDYLSHAAYREFELLCNVYGVCASTTAPATAASTSARKSTATESGKSWRFVPNYHAGENCWRSSEEEQLLEGADHLKKIRCEKVIMETEIKINDDTLTMRIVEAKDDDTDTGTEESPRKSAAGSYPNSLEDEIVCGRLVSARNSFDSAGIVQLLSDSEIDEINAQRQRNNSTPYAASTATVTPSTPSRTPKRVTFGGEIVKMRTPDSDATSSNNNQNAKNCSSENMQNAVDAGGGGSETLKILSPMECTTQALSLEIPNDNTKPLQQEHSRDAAGSASKSNSPLHTSSTITNAPASPAMQRKDSNASSISTSPRSPFKRISVSSVDCIISPKVQHKEIEVLHNLQRDPSPVRIRRASLRLEEDTVQNVKEVPVESMQKQVAVAQASQPAPPPPKSWEELGIVSDDVLMDLRSGDWRYRLRGICYLEEALRSSDNLAKVQPCLDTLLRVLLSSERNTEVAEDKRRLIVNLISRLPLDNLEDRTVQIMTGLCRQGGAGSNRVCKALMQRLPPAAIVLKLISDEFLHAKSSRFRENALQMVMYSLMTFPSTCFDTTTCVTNATYAALNRKKRVRQAALEVLAILGQVTSARAVLEIVQQIAAQRDEGPALMTAVKMRLSRKQLPLVTADGVVQYTLRVPSPRCEKRIPGAGTVAVDVVPLDSDIEWINAGVGSVSPTSLKRRAQRQRSISQQSFRCLPNLGQEQDASASAPGTSGSQSGELYPKYRQTRIDGNGPHIPGSNDDNQPHNIQYVLGSSVPLHYGAVSKKGNVDYTNYGSRRMVAKSCSDSSMDGRSSDSTYTSSSGNGAAIAVGCVAEKKASNSGISGRFTRQVVNSRFPAMDRMDLNATYVRVHKPSSYQPGMGAYAQLQQQQYNMNSTYPKVNYTMPQQQRKKLQQAQHPQQQQQQYHSQQPNYHHNQRINVTTQENFKQQENHSNEKSNNNSATADGNLDGTYTICTGIANDTAHTHMQNQHSSAQIANGGGGNNGVRRFVNVEKLIKQSNKYSQTNGSTANANQKSTTPTVPMQTQSTATTATPTSAKSTTYSQKSTATAKSQQSSNRGDTSNAVDPAIPKTTTATPFADEAEPKCSTPTTTLIGKVQSAASNDELTSESPTKWTTGEEVLQLEDVVDAPITEVIEEIDASISRLQRHGSTVSLQSKAESIRTQLDGTPSNLSRTQSAKSLIIEDIIEDNTSFVMLDEVGENPIPLKQPLKEDVSETAASELTSREDELEQVATNAFGSPQLPVTPSKTRSPTIAELKSLSRRSSMIKSMESLYERPSSKQDSLDQSTTTETSSQSSAQLNQSHDQYSIPIKPQHTPLKQKSKTSHFLKSNRRISPVKRSIKMTQAELFPQTLTGFERPREALLKCFDQFDSSNWEVIIVGLKTMVRLTRYHQETLDNHMHMVCIQLTKAVRNLRSQVARAACQAATELFGTKSKSLEVECDDLACALLHRSADTNRFLRADAMRGLESMCDNMMPSKVLNILTTKGASHQNALVRTTTAKLLNRLVERLGSDKIFNMPRESRDKFFITGANLLQEGSLETRSYAKSLFRQLSEHSNYNRLLIEVIPARTYRNVEKTLKSIRS